MFRLLPFSLVATLVFLSTTGCSDDGNNPIDAAPDAPIDALGPANCRDTSTCPPNEVCTGPNDTTCGIPPREECDSALDCQNGDACHAIFDGCSPDGVGSMCGPSCTPGEACGDGFVCNPDGACIPVACDDPSYDCRPSEVCDPSTIDPAGPVHAITHGCAFIACTGDDDTPCPGDAVCVNNYCQDGLGTCSPPVP